MKYRKLGNTELLVSEVGFGAWAIGGPAMAGDIPIGWGDVDDKTSIAAMKKAKDLGINFYDTADFYGLGHSEVLIGDLFGNDSDVIIASKVGHRLDNNQKIYLDYSKDYVIQACEKSLSRLKRETIDFYQLHAAKLDHLQNGECIQSMQELQQQGKIRYWGISLNTYDPEPEAEFMLENEYLPKGQGFQLVFNIINQKALSIVGKASDNGIGVIARMPLQFGLLTRKFQKHSRFSKSDHRRFRLPANVLEQSLDDLEALWPIADKYNIGYDAFALSFILSHSGVSTVIPGIKTPEQAIANTKNIVKINESDLDIIHELFEERFKKLLQFMKEQG
jgi:aryl-alcohol dehydrogenase-like predicted oxidoreductase